MSDTRILSLLPLLVALSVVAGCAQTSDGDPPTAPTAQYTPESELILEEDMPAGLAPDQQLIVAAFRLQVDKVKALLAAGANPNARMGRYDRELFRDDWSLGYSHMGSREWTPLLALASSHREPQPKERAKNTSEGRDEARRKQQSIHPKWIIRRNERRVAIARLLIAARADLNAADYRGNTALAESIYNHYHELSLLLISSGANSDTKTGVYIDGTGDITPMHRATDSPEVLAAMIDRGAKVNVRSTDGRTPLHWAVGNGNEQSVRLLLAANADFRIKNQDGQTAVDLAKDYARIDFDEHAAARRTIAKMLTEAAAKPER